VLRQGRAIGWIVDALEPLAATHPHVDRRRLAIAIRATCGIEAMVWLTDVAAVAPRRLVFDALLGAGTAQRGVVYLDSTKCQRTPSPSLIKGQAR
jgi:hypothetical protein